MKIVMMPRQRMRECVSDTFDIQRHFLIFMQSSVFNATLSRYVRKRATRDLKTAGVTYDMATSELTLWYNPDFMASLPDHRVQGVLRHEFYHIIFKHVSSRRRQPHHRWNLGCDMSIDWLIVDEAVRVNGSKGLTIDQYPLPLFTVRPGHLSWVFDSETYRERAITMEEHAAKAVAHPGLRGFDVAPDVFLNVPPTEDEQLTYALMQAIKAAPPNMTSEWYFDYLAPFMKEEDTEWGLGDLDEHAGWVDLPDDVREKIEAEIRATVERAVRAADQQANGWGDMAIDVRDGVRRSVTTNVDCRAVLLSFFGRCNKANSRSSVRTRNRKTGLAHPGVLTGHTAHLVLVIDQSGSVDNELLERFFAFVEGMSKLVTITILPFDAACKVEDAWVWKKGTRPKLERTKCGGTDFDAPTDVINQHARSKGWEGAVFVTDGICSQPGPCFVPRLWLLGPGNTLPWETNETVVIMDDGPAQGAWR